MNYKKLLFVENRILLNSHDALSYVLIFVVFFHQIWHYQTSNFANFVILYKTYLFDNIIKFDDTEIETFFLINWTFQSVKLKLKLKFEIWNIVENKTVNVINYCDKLL